MEMKRKVITTTMNIFWGITIMRMMTGVSTTDFLDSQNNFKVKCVKPRELYETPNLCNFIRGFRGGQGPLSKKSQKYSVS